MMGKIIKFLICASMSSGIGKLPENLMNSAHRTNLLTDYACAATPRIYGAKQQSQS